MTQPLEVVDFDLGLDLDLLLEPEEGSLVEAGSLFGGMLVPQQVLGEDELEEVRGIIERGIRNDLGTGWLRSAFQKMHTRVVTPEQAEALLNVVPSTNEDARLQLFAQLSSHVLGTEAERATLVTQLDEEHQAAGAEILEQAPSGGAIYPLLASPFSEVVEGWSRSSRLVVTPSLMSQRLSTDQVRELLFGCSLASTRRETLRASAPLWDGNGKLDPILSAFESAEDKAWATATLGDRPSESDWRTLLEPDFRGALEDICSRFLEARKAFRRVAGQPLNAWQVRMLLCAVEPNDRLRFASLLVNQWDGTGSVSTIMNGLDTIEFDPLPQAAFEVVDVEGLATLSDPEFLERLDPFRDEARLPTVESVAREMEDFPLSSAQLLCVLNLFDERHYGTKCLEALIDQAEVEVMQPFITALRGMLSSGTDWPLQRAGELLEEAVRRD